MIVVDASVMIKLVTKEPDAEAALARVIREDERFAPDWIRIEVANALARKVRNDGLPEDVASAALAATEHYLTGSTDSLDLLDEAFSLSLRTRHALYDCLYLALALRHEAKVLTADVEFVRSCSRAGLSAHVELLA